MPVIIIVGQRRSGSTAFWNAFRKDRRLKCYDEPFNPNLATLPSQNDKGTRDEIIALHETASDFTEQFAPIGRLEETTAHLQPEQATYLHWLLNQHSNDDTIVIDSVRLGFKLASLHACVPDSILVHLHRSPQAWVSSQLLPSGRFRWRKPLGDAYRHFSFWRRRGFFNNWGYEQIIDQEIAADAYWESADLRIRDLQNHPAVVKLLAFWRWAFIETERQGKEHWGDHFVSVSFEDFCDSPAQVMQESYRLGGVGPVDLDLSFIRKPNPGHQPGAAKWRRAFEAARYPAHENLPGILLGSTRIGAPTPPA